LGGIAEFDLSNLEETNRWHLRPKAMNLSSNQDTLFFINNNDIYFIPLNTDSKPQLLLKNPNPSDIWYSMAISPFDNTIWVGNAKNYQIEGEILVFDNKPSTQYSAKYSIGMNPNSIIFYQKLY
jgi:hypothetical protein